MPAKRIVRGAIQAPCDVCLRIHHSNLSWQQGVASFGLCVNSSQEMERNWMYFRMTSPSYRILTLSSFTGGLPPPLRARRARTEATLMVSRDAVFRKNFKSCATSARFTTVDTLSLSVVFGIGDAAGENPLAAVVPAAGVRWPSLITLVSHP
jgi:hypothetical protein